MTSQILSGLMMILGGGVAGYCIRALHRPYQKRDKRGRFLKR